MDSVIKELFQIIPPLLILIGVCITMHWLYLKPKIDQCVNESIEKFRVERAKDVDEKFEYIAKQIKGLSGEILYIRSRLDGHINGNIIKK